MNADPIVAEVRAIREQLAAQFDFDLSRIVADARQRQRTSGTKVVSFAPTANSEQAGERESRESRPS